jgi:anti-sigma B factor antagonist
MNNNLVTGFDDDSAPNLSLKLQKLDGVHGGLLLRARGCIDCYSADFFLKAGSKALAAGYTRLVIDLREVPYASSAAVGALTFLLKSAKQKNGNVVLQNIQPRVQEILSLLGFSQFFLRTGSIGESIDVLAPRPVHPLFPSVFACPVCRKKLRTGAAGRFRCAECRTILVVDPGAMVMVG